MDWSSGALQALTEYCGRMRQEVDSDGYEGADPEEVAEDIKRHVEEDLRTRGVLIVTREQVQLALDRLGQPSVPDQEEQMPQQAEPEPSEEPCGPGDFSGCMLLLFGVMAPIITLFVELATGMCADDYFDPIPTMGHTFAIAIVPLANILALMALNQPEARVPRWLVILNGAAIAISGYYTLLFLPLLPLAAIAVAFMGMGLLPLSPLLSLMASLSLRQWLRDVAPTVAANEDGARGKIPQPAVPGLVTGLLLGIGVLAASSAPTVVTDIGVHMAASDTPDTSQRGVRFLRKFGSESWLLKRCYGQQQSGTDPLALILNIGDPVGTTASREIYYRVTGQAFNSVAPPDKSQRERWLEAPGMFAGSDPDLGGTEVGQRSHGLRLASSRIDAQIDADAAFAYTEWTLAFENRSKGESLEARTMIALPPGGVVSRLTLWVDGEEREAAFAGRSDVRKAYEDIVAVSRDPVLVTAAGRDRVLMQCFPVLPTGREMKVRLGITAPLELSGEAGSATRGQLRLPSFIERNFAVDTVDHALWIEAHRPLDPGRLELLAQEPADGRFALRGTLSNASLSSLDAIVGVERDGQNTRSWTPVAMREDIVQVVRTEPISAATRIIMVVDGSVGMGPFRESLAKALSSLPEGCEFTLLFAGDGVDTAMPLAIASANTPREARGIIGEYEFAGGGDAVPALVAALDLAVGHKHARILWVHGSQPIKLQPSELLVQFADRCSGERILHHMQIAPGPNIIMRELASHGALLQTPRSGMWETDLSNLLASWGGGDRFLIERSPISTTSFEREGPAASMHLARLWARDEVERIATERSPSARASAIALAVEHQLVTSVTGAVVLETSEQYERAGLEVGGEATVPILPEPAFALIVLLAAMVGLASFIARRRRARGVSP